MRATIPQSVVAVLLGWGGISTLLTPIPVLPPIDAGTTVPALVVGLASLLAAAGLFLHAEWARWLGVGLAGLSLLTWLAHTVRYVTQSGGASGDPLPAVAGYTFYLVIPLLMLWVLLRRWDLPEPRT